MNRTPDREFMVMLLAIMTTFVFLVYDWWFAWRIA